MNESNFKIYYKLADRGAEEYIESPMFTGLPLSTKILMKNAYVKAFLYGASTYLGTDIPEPVETKTETIEPTPVTFDGLL